MSSPKKITASTKMHTRQQHRALHFIVDRTVRTFQPAGAFIRIQTDDQDVALIRRTRQVIDVPQVQDIEASVGEDDALTQRKRCRLTQLATCSGARIFRRMISSVAIDLFALHEH